MIYLMVESKNDEFHVVGTMHINLIGKCKSKSHKICLKGMKKRERERRMLSCLHVFWAAAK
jgi:hypothetical protein